MYRSTTPQHTFTLPFPAANLNWLRATYSQHGTIILTKNLNDTGVTTQTSTVLMNLTQAETKLFEPGQMDIQVRCGRTATEALASQIITRPVFNVLDDTNLP